MIRDNEDNPTVIVLTESEHTTPIKFNKGDIIAVELYENPSTGYIWRYTIKDENVIAFESAEFTELKTYDWEMGSSGKRLFEFRAEGKGSTTIIFEFYRTWEDVVVKKHVFNFEVL